MIPLFSGRRRSPAGRAATFAFALFVMGCSTGGDAPMSRDLTTDLGWVPANARMVAAAEPARMTDAARAFASAVDPRFGALLDSAETRFHTHMRGFPFDPARDIHRVWAWATGDSAIAVMARADFDAAALVDSLSSHLGDSTRTRRTGGDFWTMGHGRRSGTLGVMAPDLMVVGSDARSFGNGPMSGPGERLLDRIRAVAVYPVWAVVTSIDLPSVTGDSLHSAPLSQLARVSSAVQDAAMAVQPLDDRMEGVVFLWPKDGVTAGDLADVLRGAISGVRMSGGLPIELDERLSDLRIDDANGRVRIQSTLTAEEARDLANRLEKLR